MYTGLVTAAPFLMWKLVSSLGSGEEGAAVQNDLWARGEEEHFEAVALHSFRAGRREEISVEKQQQIRIAPREKQPRVRGWLLAAAADGKVGLVPANYIKVVGKRQPVNRQEPDVVSGGKDLENAFQ